MKNQEIEWLLQEKYQGVESEAFLADCARLTAGEPLAYLIGHTPFLDCSIYLDSHPLIPRVETEYWVEQAITAIKHCEADIAPPVIARHEAIHDALSNPGLPRSARKDEARGRTPKILDLCAGSGAIGVAVAKAVPTAEVTFAELDPLHLPTIEKNLELNVPMDQNFRVIESDLFSAISAGEKFDFVLTNPPYIDVAAHTVAANVATHEPYLALFGGVAGMEIIARIIAEAPSYLAPAGQLWIEHEPAQVEAIAALAAAHHFAITTHPDQYSVPRFSVLSMAQ